MVVDYKTGPPRNEEDLHRDLQVRAYAVALARERRSDEVTVELHWLQTAERPEPLLLPGIGQSGV